MSSIANIFPPQSSDVERCATLTAASRDGPTVNINGGNTVHWAEKTVCALNNSVLKASIYLACFWIWKWRYGLQFGANSGL